MAPNPPNAVAPVPPTPQSLSAVVAEVAGDPTATQPGPDTPFTFPEVGTCWAERFEILESIGQEAGGRVYRARDLGQGSRIVALWLLPPAVRAGANRAALAAELPRVQRLEHKNLVGIHEWGEALGGLFAAMEFVSGQRLSDLMAKKRKLSTSPAFSAKGAYNLVVNLLQALGAIHAAGLFHGALTPASVLVDGRGRVRLLGLGLSRHLPASRHHPEYRAAAELGGVAADLLAVALLFAELVTGRQGDEALSALAPALAEAVRLPRLAAAPGAVPLDAEGLRVALQEAMKQGRDEDGAPRARTEPVSELEMESLTGERTTPPPVGNGTPPPAPRRPTPPPMPPASARPQPPASPSPPSSPAAAAAPRSLDESSPGHEEGHKRSHTAALLHRALDRIKAPGGGKQESVWLAHRDGLDYGPFTLDELVDRVRHEEFDQTTLVQDLASGQRKPLLEFAEFAQPLARLLREREAKRREAEAVRSGQIRAAKKMGKGMMFLIILGSATFVGISSWIFLKSPEPKELLYAEATASLGRPITLPPIEPAEAIAGRIQADEAAKAQRQARAREMARLNHVPQDERVLGSDREFEGVVQKIDLSSEGSTGQPLSDAEVDRGVRVRWGQFSSCIAKELKRNPNLDHATITFWVRGDGSVGGTKILSNGTQRMFQCLQQEVAALRFRAYGGPPRKVTYPLQVSP